ncbi:hypothetical protein D3C80_1034670 [compost metagenome]
MPLALFPSTIRNLSARCSRISARAQRVKSQDWIARSAMRFSTCSKSRHPRASSSPKSAGAQGMMSSATSLRMGTGSNLLPFSGARIFSIWSISAENPYSSLRNS